MKKENKENVERVVVHLRIRPLNEEELQGYTNTPFEKINETENSILVKKDFDQKVFNFDTISNSNIKQMEIFEKSSKEIIDVYNFSKNIKILKIKNLLFIIVSFEWI